MRKGLVVLLRDFGKHWLQSAKRFKIQILSGLIEQVESIDISAVQSVFIDISITLEGKPTTIRFSPKHLLALQVAIKKIREIENNEN